MSPAKSPLGDKIILLMEDNPVLGLEVAFALEDEGAAVKGPVARLESGLEVLNGSVPDAAVLDVELADGEVFPLAERLRERGVPFVFYTARGSEGHMRARAGDAPVISKSFGSATVIEALRERIAAGAAAGSTNGAGSANGTNGAGGASGTDGGSG